MDLKTQGGKEGENKASLSSLNQPVIWVTKASKTLKNDPSTEAEGHANSEYWASDPSWRSYNYHLSEYSQIVPWGQFY